MVFLLNPNNPLGETYSTKDLKLIEIACRKVHSKILIDRVCQMPWDSKTNLSNVFMDGILEGRVYVVDSFSKSEGLAGIRTGYIVSNPETRDLLLEEIRYRSLNPIIFSTKTLVFCNLANMLIECESNYTREKYRKFFSMYSEHYLSEYPSNERYVDLYDEFEVFFTDYIEDRENHKKHIVENYQIAQEAFDNYKLVDITLQQGFNVAVCLDKMFTENELSDQISLAQDVGVGVLPESCFRYTKSNEKNYFIRVALSITKEDFFRGCLMIKNYFYP